MFILNSANIRITHHFKDYSTAVSASDEPQIYKHHCKDQDKIVFEFFFKKITFILEDIFNLYKPVHNYFLLGSIMI